MCHIKTIFMRSSSALPLRRTDNCVCITINAIELCACAHTASNGRFCHTSGDGPNVAFNDTATYEKKKKNMIIEFPHTQWDEIERVDVHCKA